MVPLAFNNAAEIIDTFSQKSMCGGNKIIPQQTARRSDNSHLSGFAHYVATYRLNGSVMGAQFSDPIAVPPTL
jgi:hypothetical protein